MSKVRIVTDSTTCLPPELIEQYDIRVMPLGLVIDGKACRDGVDITTDEFWEMFKDLKVLKDLEEHPTTTAVTPGEFVNVFSELAKTTDSIVCILVSRALSATHESAYHARRLVRPEHPNLRIEIIDSRTSVGAQGFIVLEAARAAQENKSLEEVTDIIRDMMSRVIYIATLDTLKYLIKSGRAPKSTTVGELLGVKPVIGFVDDTGLLEVIARVRGKQKTISKMVDLVKKYIDTQKPVHIMVHHCDSLQDAGELKEMVTSRYRCVESYMTEYTPVMVTHTGPMLGLSFYS